LCGGVGKIADVSPYVTEPVRQISLDKNFRQSEWLARLSDCFRAFTDGGSSPKREPCGAPIHTYDDQAELAELIATKIGGLPGAANVVVIGPSVKTAQDWLSRIGPSLKSAFRNPIVSDRARLTERLTTHFTTPLEAKGLEFDVVVVPDTSEFDDNAQIDLNGLYVAVSRPRYAVLLGCKSSRAAHKVMKQLCERGDLIPYRCASSK
jgi:hypothetical protein